MYGKPTDYSFYFPYAFRADFTPNTATQEASGAILKATIYPNPVSNYATLNFTLPNNSDVKIKIYNSIGQEVKSLDFKDLMIGENNVQIQASEMNNGVYIYTIQTDKYLESKQFVIQR